MFKTSKNFSFLEPLEHNWQAIRDEYLAVSNKTSEWSEINLHNRKWDTLGIFFKGNRLEGEKFCPLTTSLVHEIPGLYIAGFSILRPGCVIRPHVGYTSTVLRSHLGLICPNNAWIEVGSERRGWTEGEVIVFDDTILHRAANESDSDRVVLIIDFLKLVDDFF